MKVLVIILMTAGLLWSHQSVGQDISRARSLAGAGNFNEAIAEYNKILDVNPGNTAARIGRGYTYSWDRQFNNATADFNQVLISDPSNLEAKKGLAYIELWSGNTARAINSFNALINAYPGTKEFYVARGQAQMEERALIDARASFLEAARIDPADKEVKNLLYAVRTKPTILDIDVLGGITKTGNSTKTGLRFIQLSSQVSKKLQLSAKYDNTLSMDNLGLITNKKAVPYYSGSLYYVWNQRTATRIEGGFRNYPDVVNKNELSGESQFSLEQVLFFKKGNSLKGGVAVINPNVGNTAYLLLAGYHHPVSSKFTAGINYFYANRNVFNTVENRILADGDIALGKGNMLNIGMYYGRSSSDLAAFNGNTYGGFLRGYFPVSNAIGIHAGLSAENNFIQNLFNANLGLRFRLEQ